MRRLLRSGAILVFACSLTLASSPAWATSQQQSWSTWVKHISSEKALYVTHAKKLLADVGASKSRAIATDALNISGDSAAIAKLDNTPAAALNKLVYAWAVDMEAVAVYALEYSKAQTKPNLKMVVAAMYSCTAGENAVTKWYNAHAGSSS
jgi:nucleoside phosphorylase